MSNHLEYRQLMQEQTKPRHGGFVLIEALIALLLIAIGLAGVSQLQSMSMAEAGQAKSRSEAAALSQEKLEEVRNLLVKTAFTGTPLVTGSATVTGSNAVYAMAWTVSTPAGGLEQRLVQLTTTWTDSRNVAQRLDLNSVVAWDDPGGQGKLANGLGGSLISPTGFALRGTGTYTGTETRVMNADGSKIVVDNGTTYLLNSADGILLYLPPVNDVAQAFSTITGRIFFDQGAGNNAIPSSANVRVRLSSEGECIYNNAVADLFAIAGDGHSYKYFTYTCYVGPGWYGNVGVLVDDSVNGGAASPTICLGDPSFHTGVSDGTLISAHPLESATRSYRGFKASGSTFLSTGMGSQSVVDQAANPLVSMPWSGTKYGLSYQGDGTPLTGPFDGRPRPSDYASYGVTPLSATDYFEQNFLVTEVSGNGKCNDRMAASIFTRNAGKYVCINPDNDPATDACPAVWPNFENQVGSPTTPTPGACNTPISGTVYEAKGNATVTASYAGSVCTIEGTTKNYSCILVAPQGTSVTLTNQRTTGQPFITTKVVTATCIDQTGVNFPPP